MLQTTATSSLDRLHADFLVLLPRIQTHAAIVFRHVCCHSTRAEMIEETIGLAWKWFVRLAERGKDVHAFATTFIAYAARAVNSGRRTCGQEKAKDVLSPVAQRKHGFKVDSLPSSTRTANENLYSEPYHQRLRDTFEERLRENRVTSIPDQVVFRLDWPQYFNSLSTRDRALAEYLSMGNTAKDGARRFGLSRARVTQLRQRWHREWAGCQDEEAVQT